MLREEEHLLDEVGDVFALEAVLHRGAVPASADDPSGTHLRQVLGNSRGRALERGGEVTHDHRALQQQPGHPQTGRISQKLEHLRGGDGEVTPTSKLHICAHTYMLHNMHSDAQQNTHDHDHGAHGNGEHAHDHGGVWGRIRHVLIPHSHDAADSIDDTLVPGTRICFTGTAQDGAGRIVERWEMEKLATSAGLTPVKTVSKTRCDVLVTAEAGTQSGKARKAQEYGKPVFNADEFLAWLATRASAAE